MVLGTQRVAGAEPHRVQRLAQVTLQDGRLPQRHQAAERALAVGCRRVDQDARHLGAIRAGIPGVDPLPERCRRVAALQRKLADQGVGERVQQHEPQAGEEVLGRAQAPVRPPLLVGVEELQVEPLDSCQPVLDLRLGELEEDPLAPDLVGRDPGRSCLGRSSSAGLRGTPPGSRSRRGTRSG